MRQITEAQVKDLLPVQECIEVLRVAFLSNYINIPRHRLKSTHSLLHVMSGSIPDAGIMGLKAYGTSQSNASFAVLLFDEKNGSLLAVFEADALGQIRTGAASGLATDLLAVPEARIGAVIGTGFQAETQVVAIDSVRRLEEIRIFSRSEEKRKAFIERMQMKVRSKLIETQNARECVQDADIVCTITGSKNPVVEGAWLKEGCHVNAAGSNWGNKRELDLAAMLRFDLICVDDLEQSKIESGDLILAIQEAADHSNLSWDKVVELSDVVKGEMRRSSPNQLTLFKSNGIALEDIAAAHHIYSKILQEAPASR